MVAVDIVTMAYAFDPELEPLISMLPGPDLTDVNAARALLAGLLAGINDAVDTTGLTITDLTIDGPDGNPLPIRIYAPASPATRAAVVTFHGGGFVMGSIDTEHAGAVGIARAVDVVVVAVDYRLAPEHPCPAGIEDCYAGLCWTVSHADELGIDPARIGVHGASAGGGLAAGVALMARDRGGPKLAFQYLGIPELDDRLETPSMQAFVDTPLWNRPNAVLSWQYYLGGQPASTYAAPARAEDVSGLPAAYVSAMEFDPLRDEAIVYALRMLQAGVPVELHTYPGTFHGSSMMVTAASSRRQALETVDVLRRLTASRAPVQTS